MRRPAGLLAAALALVAAAAGRAPAADWQLIPLPMYTTVPNEGSTYGAMPVLMDVGAGGAVAHILAPSVSWNSAAGITGTFRYYRYFERLRSASVIASASTRINRTLWLTYDDLPAAQGRATVEAVAMVRRNLFFRFFGFGPRSRAADEASYTRTTTLAGVRWGLNLVPHFNVGLRLGLRRDDLEEHAIFDLPTVQQAHPGAPGLDGAAQAQQLVSLRYDTRDGGDYARRGVALELAGGPVEGLRGFDGFWQITAQARALIEETRYLQGAGRLHVGQQLGGNDVPFYYQSLLGGEMSFRGFPEDRFVDRGAWELELEQRLRLLETHLFGVTTDWRIDPFVAVGQVYHTARQALSRVRVAAGLGLRAFVRPNVLGRVDLAYSGEGLRAYVVLGYPY